MTSSSPIRIRAKCLARNFQLKPLYESLIERGKATLVRDAILVEQGENSVFIFDYGVIIFWGVEYDEQTRLENLALQFATTTLDTPTEDELDFSARPEYHEIKIRNDLIEHRVDDSMIRLSFSHALAQSVKLEEFENSVQKTIEKTHYIPAALAKNGVVPLGRKELSKERGNLFLTKSNVHLHYGLLDTPEFFWEYPELEPHYLALSRYLEVHQRIDALNQKLEVIQELLDMLADEQKHKHSSLLEWIIIILIAVEILLFFWH